MSTCEYCSMSFASRRCWCGIAYCDEVCQRRDYVRQHKDKCRYRLLREMEACKMIPDDVIKLICKRAWESRRLFFEIAWCKWMTIRDVSFMLQVSVHHIKPHMRQPGPQQLHAIVIRSPTAAGLKENDPKEDRWVQLTKTFAWKYRKSSVEDP